MTDEMEEIEIEIGVGELIVSNQTAIMAALLAKYVEPDEFLNLDVAECLVGQLELSRDYLEQDELDGVARLLHIVHGKIERATN